MKNTNSLDPLSLLLIVLVVFVSGLLTPYIFS
jgi:hypothetical protein